MSIPIATELYAVLPSLPTDTEDPVAPIALPTITLLLNPTLVKFLPTTTLLLPDVAELFIPTSVFSP